MSGGVGTLLSPLVAGERIVQTEGIQNSFKYAGEIYDAEMEKGLYYLRARYYDPSIGRFLNEDTYEGQIDNPLSLNLYTYTHNNPLLYIDPTGNCIWDACVAESISVVILIGGAVVATIGAGITKGVAMDKAGINIFDTYDQGVTVIQQPGQ
ncbi:RHS repeat-associated core domain-containing protein [Paenibacillus sp. FSL H7-0357]|uniref:RHS repeat-associated core domain-containing protein n=1 Tax=Paenibacillus sp. FSL H7-0357 TaxID=1536774 RepID=UPI0009E05BCC|nr:RHS repeat-associated core domain-containing protein [Paenibacillus sp. FSL H7-0357]